MAQALGKRRQEPQRRCAVWPTAANEPRGTKKIQSQLSDGASCAWSVQQEWKERHGVELSVQRVRFWLRRWGFRWRRVRKSLKKHRDEVLFEFFKQEVADLVEAWKQGQIDLFSYDEAGFNLNPSPSHAWLKKGSDCCLPAERGRSLTVAGFFSRDNRLEAYSLDGPMNADAFIAFVDDFAQNIHKKTVVLIDIVPFHHAAKVKAKLQEWKAKNLFFQFLPPYSPELNWIEILWRNIKHYWLSPKDYSSFKQLRSTLEKILNNVGTSYFINFN